jgi:hypothetical protein
MATHTMLRVPGNFAAARQKVFPLSKYKIRVTTECEGEAPHTFWVEEEAPNAATAMVQAKNTLARAYVMGHAKGEVTGPAWMSWWIDGRAHEAERALMVAQRVPAGGDLLGLAGR